MGSYYRVIVAAGGRTDEFLIVKADTTETLLDALADDPTPVTPTALEAYAIPSPRRPPPRASPPSTPTR